MTYVMKQYDEALLDIYANGWEMPVERTGKGCRAKLGLTTRFDISKQFPVLSYRKMAWKSFVKEVLWYITGSDNIHDLEKTGCNVWTPWINDDFTQSRMFNQGSIGYGYGPNLIHFGAEFSKIHPLRGGTNQLDYVINTLRSNPNSRQAMFVLWRPDRMNNVLLPPCHFAYHFMVSPNMDGEMKVLNCELFQRSADYSIGVPANVFMASIFTYLIAQQLDMVPGELIHSASHCHIYHNALDATKEYLDRTETLIAHESPVMVINKRDSIYDYSIDDFTLEGYQYYDKINFPIAV